MIRVVMFDLGKTLIDGNDHPFPHVADALTAIAALKTADGKLLQSCLVSDFDMPDSPVTAAKVTAIFDAYLERLGGTGLRPFFEPVSKRVTLSTHAGFNKPDRRIFDTALRRLGADVSLEECLLITEEKEHVRVARDDLHMKALQFRKAPSTQFDFDDWGDAPALVANLVAAP
jgi:FMN phosphatase YigB (HAD superfamily)